MEAVEIKHQPFFNDTEVHQMEFVHIDRRKVVCIAEFQRIQNISEVKIGDKFICVLNRPFQHWFPAPWIEKIPILWEVDRISSNFYLVVKNHGSFAFWNCFRMINP